MFAIGQTVLFNKSVKGHVVYVGKKVSVRTSITGTYIDCVPNELEILSEEALPLEADNIATDTSVKSAKLPLKVNKSQPAAGTKLSRAIEIYKVLRATDGFTRKSCMAMFQESLQMTEAGSSTYYSMCQRATLN